MSVKFKKIIENMRELSAEERAHVVHCLISSLETMQDEGVVEAWADLAEKRFTDLESGAVNGIPWQDIKQGLKC